MIPVVWPTISPDRGAVSVAISVVVVVVVPWPHRFPWLLISIVMMISLSSLWSPISTISFMVSCHCMLISSFETRMLSSLAKSGLMFPRFHVSRCSRASSKLCVNYLDLLLTF